MAKCIIKSCNSSGCDLFCPPEDKRKLRVWKEILQTEKSDFLICSLHFQDKFICSDKFLLPNSYPSILINPDEEFNNIKSCQSCLKNFEESDVKYATAANIRKIFHRATNLRVNN